MNGTTNSAEVGSSALVRHVCGYCLAHYTGKDGGWGRFITTDNPSKTDWCAICGHRGEGVKMPGYLNEWKLFRVLPNACVLAHADENLSDQ